MKFEQIMANLQKKVYHPIYLLQGEEAYFIDKISDFIEENVLEDAEKDFNQSIFYGIDTETQDIVNVAKRYPMMASHNVVIVKEAQNLKKIEELEAYLENPTPSTILVLCHKYKKLDQRKRAGKLIAKKGVILNTTKLRDYEAGAWIEKYVQEKSLKIGPKASSLLLEFMGVDLSNITNAIDKFTVILNEGEEITPELIEKNIGISKDYNIFELNKALGQKNIQKSNKIVKHFALNPKAYPLPMLMPGFYMFFSKLLLFHAVKKKTDQEIAATLGVHKFFLKDYKTASQNYDVKKLARIISYLRECDNKSKGIENSSTPGGDLLKELVFKILH